MTLDEFRDHLAENIGAKGDGNTLSADRANYLERVIRNCHAELMQLGVSDWVLEDMPGHVIESFADYCTASISRFGRDRNPPLKAAALAELRYIGNDRRTGRGWARFF